MLAKELKEKLATIADDVEVQLCIEDTVKPGYIYLGTSKITIDDNGDFALLTSILDFKTSDDWDMEDEAR
jgi:hypothetical protein